MTELVLKNLFSSTKPELKYPNDLEGLSESKKDEVINDIIFRDLQYEDDMYQIFYGSDDYDEVFVIYTLVEKQTDSLSFCNCILTNDEDWFKHKLISKIKKIEK